MIGKTCSIGWGASMNGERIVVSDADSDLIARFLAGDRAAFDSLFLKYQDYVYNITYGIVGGTEEARDVTQDIFVQVFRALPGFRKGSRFSTWLYRIATNRALDYARSNRNKVNLPLEDTLRTEPDPGQTPAQSAELAVDREKVQALLMEVPVQHRDVLVLRYFQELSLEEITGVLGCSLAATKLRLHRARKYFKERYESGHADE